MGAMPSGSRRVLVIEDDAETAEQLEAATRLILRTAERRPCLIKPFAPTEMLARVDALARRSTAVVRETILRVGGLQIELLAPIARRDGCVLELLPREFRLLDYLARSTGQIVSRAMPLQHVWVLHFDPTTNIIDAYVGRLRRRVDAAGSYALIHTVRSIGFRLRAPQ